MIARALRCGIVALSLPWVATCAPDAADTSGWAGTVDTLANGAVRVASPADGLWTPGTAWRLEEELRIGSLESEGPDLFGTVLDLAVDDLGRIWVIDRQAMEVRVFGPGGEWVRTVGREGEGPGEFAGPDALRWGPEGDLWVVDQGNARISVFDTTGAYRTAHRRPPEASTGHYIWPGTVLADATVLDATLIRTETELQNVLVRWDTAGAVLDTFRLPAFERRLWVARSEGGMAQAPVPHTPNLRWEARPDGTLWFGTGEDYRIVQRNLATADTLRIVERRWDPVPISGEEKDSAMVGYDWLVQQGGRIDRSDIPDTRPAFRDFFVDDSGRLWVRPEVAADSLRQRRFDVFDAEGRYLGPVDSPVDLPRAPRVVGDRVYGVTRDELGVNYVVRLRIVR